MPGSGKLMGDKIYKGWGYMAGEVHGRYNWGEVERIRGNMPKHSIMMSLLHLVNITWLLEFLDSGLRSTLQTRSLTR